MNKIWVISRKDISEAFHIRSMYVFIVVMLLLTFSYTAAYNRGVKPLSGAQAVAFSRGFLTSLAYVLPMMYSIFVCSIFSNYTVIVDKAKRNIESLLATPASVNQIWLGKSLAVTLPSVMIGLSVSVLAYVFMNYGLVIPKTGVFILPDALAILSALVIVPLLVFAIVAIVTNIQLMIANPRIANFVFTGIFVLLVLGINAAGGLGVSLNFFPLLYLGMIILCGATSYVLSRLLTKEKVLLSSKM